MIVREFGGVSRRRAVWLGVAACLALSVPACAQMPTVPAAPAGAPVVAVPGAPAPVAAPANLWSFLCMTPEQRAACTTRCCNSAIGQMLSGFAGPVALMSGGLVQNRCATNAIANDLKKPADSPEGAAARIKADEADAAARREAVRYLGTVDCERWPEAVDTLKNALRKDRNECVRFEAALAILNGCCCNVQIIEALKNCVLGEFKLDPNPPERSDRVRAVAAEALARCVLVEPLPPPLPPPGLPPRVEGPPADPEEYYKRVAAMPRSQVVSSARAVLVSMQKPATEPPPPVPVPGAPPPPPALLPPPQPLPPGVAGPVPVGPMPFVSIGVPVHPTSISGIVANAFALSDHPILPHPRFLTNLTRELTGKQEYMVPGRHPLIPPVNTAPPPASPPAPETPPPPPATAPAPAPAPMPVPRPNGNIAQTLVMPPASDIEPAGTPRMPPAMPASPEVPAPAAELLPPQSPDAGGGQR